MSSRERRSRSEARSPNSWSRPADIRCTSSERSPKSTTGIFPTRRTPVTVRPASESSGGSGSTSTTSRSVSSGVSPTNGGRPVRHSYRIAPSAYTSAAGPTRFVSPNACSGAM